MKLTDNVREFLDEKCRMLTTQLYSYLISEFDEDPDRIIESPIEQLFYIEWRYRQFSDQDLKLELFAQFNSAKFTGKYRIDFMVDFIQEAYLMDGAINTIEWDEVIMRTEVPLLGVEIDSHIWHEKTKEQAQCHKKRERFLISKGWKLIRFTGSEVYKNPSKCVDETLEIATPLKEKYHKKLKEGFKKRDK